MELIEYETVETLFLKRKKLKLIPCKYFECGVKIEDYSHSHAGGCYTDYMKDKD
jgi:hypothetical protein